MKLSRAVALASVGWYLMLPPTTHPRSRDLWRWWANSTNPVVNECNLDAPFSEWKESGEYENLADCKAGQAKAEVSEKKKAEIDKAIDEAGGASTRSDDLKSECASYSRCVASDDPRLAK